MIPARCQTCVAPVFFKGRSLLARLTSPREGLRSRGRPEPGTSSPLRVKAADEAALVFLSEPQFLEDFDYGAPGSGFDRPRREDRVLAFDVARVPAEGPRLFSGLAMWTRVVLDEQDVIEVRGQADSHWAYVVALMSPQPVNIVDAGKITLKSSIDYSASPVRYTFDVEVPV